MGAPWKHEGCGARKDRKGLVARPSIVLENAVDAENEGEEEDGNAEGVETVREACRVDLVKATSGVRSLQIRDLRRAHRPPVLHDGSYFVQAVPERIDEEP